MLRLRAPPSGRTHKSSATALQVLRPARGTARSFTNDAAPTTQSHGRVEGGRGAGDLAARLDINHRAPRSQFGRRPRDGDDGNGSSRFLDRESPGDFRGQRRFVNRGNNFGDERGRRPSSRDGGSRKMDNAFFAEPLAAEAAANEAPYSPPTPKFLTQPKWENEEERTAWLTKHGVKMLGKDVPAPIRTWDEVGLPQEFVKHLKQFAAPTLIQSLALPIALSGRDMIGIAETGSGKTLAFAIPALASFHGETVQPRFPRVVVLAPTRELAVQTAKVFDTLGTPLGIRTACVYGGASAKFQIEDIRRGAGVIVATPGRLTDLVRSGHVSLSKVTYGVLDEADRMLDMGFAPQIDTLLQAFPKRHQTLMFSATWPAEIRSLANQYLQNGIRVQIGSEEMLANPKIKQVVEVLPHVPTMDERLQKLHDMLEKYHTPREKKNKIIVFVNTKLDADLVVEFLADKSYRASALHGDYSQAQRDRAMLHFKQGRVPILVATARGLDVPDVEYVINLFFPPGDIDQYVHRIGRTGRAGNTGVAHTIFTPMDAQKKRELLDILERANQQVPRELLHIRASSVSSGGRSGRNGRKSGRSGDGGRQRSWEDRSGGGRREGGGGGGGGGGGRFFNRDRDRTFGAEQKL